MRFVDEFIARISWQGNAVRLQKLALINSIRTLWGSHFFLIKKNLYISGCVGSSLQCGLFSSNEDYTRVVVHGLFTVLASLVTEFGLEGVWASEHSLDSYGARVYLLCGMWNPPGSGIKPVSPALAGQFFTTELPGKPSVHLVETRFVSTRWTEGFPGSSVVKNSPANAGDTGLIPNPGGFHMPQSK